MEYSQITVKKYFLERHLDCRVFMLLQNYTDVVRVLLYDLVYFFLALFEVLLLLIWNIGFVLHLLFI